MFSPPPARVHVRRCPDYGAVAAPVAALLEAALGGERLAGARVLLKVNLMRGSPPEDARTTHPEVARAVVRWFLVRGARPFLAESSGVLGFTDEVAEAAGVAAVAREEGVPFVNLDAGPFRRVRGRGRVPGDLLLPEVLFDCDLRVTLPKLKTHTLTVITGALKNQVGILPGGTKCTLHVRAGSARRLAEAVVDLAEEVPFQLGLVDAVVGLHGGGSAAGRPVALGFLAASRDLTALDAVCGQLVGIAPHEVPTTAAAAARGLGEARLEHIEVEGVQPGVPLVRFARAAPDPKRFAPLGRAFYRVRAGILEPAVDLERCTRCGTCALVCPERCISLAPTPRIGAGCVACFACRERCPSGAMLLRTPWWARRALAARTTGLPLAHLDRRS
ncbi:MAG: DUF362 domain-containing protein [Pseudomonadota bacterium]